MTSQVHSILQFESALSRDAQRKIRKIGTTDLVIGIQAIATDVPSARLLMR